MAAHDSEAWGRASRRQRRRGLGAVFLWAVGAILLVAAVAAAVYLLNVKPGR